GSLPRQARRPGLRLPPCPPTSLCRSRAIRSRCSTTVGRSVRRRALGPTRRNASSPSCSARSAAERQRRRIRPGSAMGSLTSYEPNPALAWIYRRFFEHIEVDEAWAKEVREADARGTVIYVLRNLSFVDFLALDYLTKKLDLPRVRFANDLGLWMLDPLEGRRGPLHALRPRRAAGATERLR